MTITFSSRDFNQDTGSAKKAADMGPVIITDRGRPAHVLMTYAAYLRLVGKDTRADRGATIADLLFMPGVADIELGLPTRSDPSRSADFS